MDRLAQIEGDSLDPDRHDEGADQENCEHATLQIEAGAPGTVCADCGHEFEKDRSPRCSCPYNLLGGCMWIVAPMNGASCYKDAVRGVVMEGDALDGQAALDEANNEIVRLRHEKGQLEDHVGELSLEVADLRKTLEQGPVRETAEALADVICGDPTDSDEAAEVRDRGDV